MLFHVNFAIKTTLTSEANSTCTYMTGDESR